MQLTVVETLGILAAVLAALMAGSPHLRFNLWLYSLQTMAIALATMLQALNRGSGELYLIAAAIAVLKGVLVPYFLAWVVGKIDVRSDPGTMLPIPLAMHLSIVLLGVSFFAVKDVYGQYAAANSAIASAAALSLLLTGMLFMLTRRLAVSQVIGFLIMENGIYFFALTQTKGMPMMVEMGIFLDVLVGVMIAGLIAFRIKKSFEHIDVTQLTELRD